MKDFLRKVDDLGRLCLPAELRRAHGMVEGEPVALVNTPDGILIKPTAARCVICGGSERLIGVDGTAICETCTTRAVIAMRAKATESKGKAAL